MERFARGLIQLRFSCRKRRCQPSTSRRNWNRKSQLTHPPLFHIPHLAIDHMDTTIFFFISSAAFSLSIYLPPPLRLRCVCVFRPQDATSPRARLRRFEVGPWSLKPRYRRLITQYRTPFPVFLLVPVASNYIGVRWEKSNNSQHQMRKGKKQDTVKLLHLPSSAGIRWIIHSEKPDPER